MKISEMNERQKKVFFNVLGAANEIIGGYENALMDYSEGSEEYKTYENALANHENLVSEIYESAITQIHEELLERFPGCWDVNEIRFCGKSFIMERIEARLKKMGY